MDSHKLYIHPGAQPGTKSTMAESLGNCRRKQFCRWCAAKTTSTTRDVGLLDVRYCENRFPVDVVGCFGVLAIVRPR